MKKLKAFIAGKIIAAKAALKRKNASASTGNLVLFNVSSQEAYVQFVKDIELLDNSFSAYDAIILTTEEMAPKFLFHPARKIISPKDLNFFELPKKEITGQFGNSTYKYLINTCITDCLTLDYFATILSSKLKISIYKPDNLKIYDLLLNPETDTRNETFIELTLRYLRKINNQNEQY